MRPTTMAQGAGNSASFRVVRLCRSKPETASRMVDIVPMRPIDSIGRIGTMSTILDAVSGLLLHERTTRKLALFPAP